MAEDLAEDLVVINRLCMAEDLVEALEVTSHLCMVVEVILLAQERAERLLGFPHRTPTMIKGFNSFSLSPTLLQRLRQIYHLCVKSLVKFLVGPLDNSLKGEESLVGD
jgi:hypothetical protein